MHTFVHLVYFPSLLLLHSIHFSHITHNGLHSAALGQVLAKVTHQPLYVSHSPSLKLFWFFLHLIYLFIYFNFYIFCFIFILFTYLYLHIFLPSSYFIPYMFFHQPQLTTLLTLSLSTPPFPRFNSIGCHHAY